jgi:hypothetical protein
MKKYLLKLLVWSFFAGLCSFAILSVFDHRFIPGPKKLFFTEKAPKEMDLLIIGSSRAEHVVNPKFFNADFQIYNYAMDGHGLPSNYLLLKQLVEKQGFKIGQVMLSLDEFNLNGSVGFSRKFRDDFFVDDMDDEEVYEAYQKYRGKTFAYILKHFPQTSIVVYSDIRKTLRNLPFMTRRVLETSKQEYEKSLDVFSSTRGYSPLLQKTIIKNSKKKEQYVIEPDDLEYFQKLVALCRKHNIQLNLFRAPVLHCENYQSDRFDQFIDSFTKENNIVFFDYKCRYQLDDQFFDNTHPTDSISQLISMDLSNKLQPELAANKRKETPATGKPALITMLSK